jgi:hypothetical protein
MQFTFRQEIYMFFVQWARNFPSENNQTSIRVPSIDGENVASPHVCISTYLLSFDRRKMKAQLTFIDVAKKT